MDMGGWDVIYASDVTRLNTVLAQSSQQLLPSFSYTDPSGLSFSGTFGPWNIDPGGLANRINLQVPIKEGVLNAPGFTNFKLDDLKPVLNVALTLVEGKSAPNTQDLTFDIQETTTTPGTATNGQIYLTTPDKSGLLTQRDPSGTVASMLEANLPQCFIANKEKIAFVFASVFMAPQNQPWLKPTATGISYFNSADKTIQAIAIQTITQSPWGPTNQRF